MKTKFSRIYRKMHLNLSKQSNERLSRSGLEKVMSLKSGSSSQVNTYGDQSCYTLAAKPHKLVCNTELM